MTMGSDNGLAQGSGMEIDMNQEERLNYLVEKFKEDSVRYRDM